MTDISVTNNSSEKLSAVKQIQSACLSSHVFSGIQVTFHEFYIVIKMHEIWKKNISMNQKLINRFVSSSIPNV